MDGEDALSLIVSLRFVTGTRHPSVSYASHPDKGRQLSSRGPLARPGKGTRKKELAGRFTSQIWLNVTSSLPQSLARCCFGIYSSRLSRATAAVHCRCLLVSAFDIIRTSPVSPGRMRVSNSSSICISRDKRQDRITTRIDAINRWFKNK